MSDTSSVMEHEPVEQSDETASRFPTWVKRYYVFLFLALAVAMSTNATVMYAAVAPGPQIPVDTIMAEFWNGANLIFGLTGLITLIALPYGLSFAFQFLTSIFGRFTAAIKF